MHPPLQGEVYPGVKVVDAKGLTYTIRGENYNILSMPARQIKLELVRYTDLAPEQMVLFHRGRELMDHETCVQADVNPATDKLQLLGKPPNQHPATSEHFTEALNFQRGVSEAVSALNPAANPAASADMLTVHYASSAVGAPKEFTFSNHSRAAGVAALKMSAIKRELEKRTGIPAAEMVLSQGASDFSGDETCRNINFSVPVTLSHRSRAAYPGKQATQGLSGQLSAPVLNSPLSQPGLILQFVRDPFTAVSDRAELKLDSGNHDLRGIPSRALKKALRRKVECPPEDLILRGGPKGIIIPDDVSLRQVGFDTQLVVTRRVDEEKHRRVRVKNESCDPPEEYVIHPNSTEDPVMQELSLQSARDASSAPVIEVKQALERLTDIPPAEQQLRMYSPFHNATVDLRNDATCRDVDPYLQEYVLQLTTRPPNGISSTIFNRSGGAPMRIQHSASTIRELRDLVAGLVDAKPSEFCITRRDGTVLHDNDRVVNNGVFNLERYRHGTSYEQEYLRPRQRRSTSQTGQGAAFPAVFSRSLKVRRYSLPDARTQRKFFRLEAHEPDDPVLGFGFRVGAWQGLDRASALKSSRYGRALQLQHRRRIKTCGRRHPRQPTIVQAPSFQRSSSCFVLPTGMPAATLFKYLGFRTPLVLSLSSSLRRALSPEARAQQRSANLSRGTHSGSAPRFRAGNQVPMSKLRGRASSVASRRSLSPDWDNPHSRGSSRPKIREFTPLRSRSVESRRGYPSHGWFPEQSEEMDWKQLASTMQSTAEVSRKLRLGARASINPPSPIKNVVRLQGSRGSVLHTPQALRAASLHKSLSSVQASPWKSARQPASAIQGSETRHPAFDHPTSLVERLTLIENIADSRSKRRQT
ncbi:hypothetical protein DIPPA_18238 [Diplonema papillatum]|nr:hypothetical protein DIPPA_18238 [Diplonema papillatum]